MIPHSSTQMMAQLIDAVVHLNRMFLFDKLHLIVLKQHKQHKYKH